MPVKVVRKDGLWQVGLNYISPVTSDSHVEKYITGSSWREHWVVQEGILWLGVLHNYHFPWATFFVNIAGCLIIEQFGTFFT